MPEKSKSITGAAEIIATFAPDAEMNEQMVSIESIDMCLNNTGKGRRLTSAIIKEQGDVVMATFVFDRKHVEYLFAEQDKAEREQAEWNSGNDMVLWR